MALYKDGNPVSGLNSIPRLTLAQYNALNVKPEFWVRTDAPESYKKLSADQVSYDSNNTVKDKIDSIVTEQEGTISATKIGKGVILSLYFGGMTLSSDGKTFTELIPEGFRPSRTFSITSKTYNGSNYIDCIITLEIDGKISITGDWSEAITGLQPQYTRDSFICYRVL